MIGVHDEFVLLRRGEGGAHVGTWGRGRGGGIGGEDWGRGGRRVKMGVRMGRGGEGEKGQ